MSQEGKLIPTIKSGQTIEAIKQVCCVLVTGFSGSDQKPLFIAPFNCHINKVKIVSDTATTGSGSSKKYAFQVKNKTQTTELADTAVNTDDDGEIAADTVYDLSLDQNLTLAADDVLELDITVTGSPTSLASAEVMAVVEFVNAEYD